MQDSLTLSTGQWLKDLFQIHPKPALLTMPTGSGKTWTARQALAHWAQKGYQGVYLAPLKALAQEQFHALRHEFQELRVGLLTGESTTNPRQVQILVATHEKFDVYLKNPKHHLGWLARIGVVVVDEIHLLSDRERGGRLESLLVRLLEINPFIQIIGLSATLSNAKELANWLGGSVMEGGSRPIPLETNFLKYKSESEKEEKLLSLLGQSKQGGGQTLIFVATRRRSEALEATLRSHGYRTQHHHSGLWAEERQQVESAFRQGALEILVATPTLEMGVNLPVRQVILYDAYQFDGDGFEPLSVQSFLQRAGRAGRPGLDPKGEAFFLLPAWTDDICYHQGVPERILSRLGKPALLAQFLLDAVEAGLAQSKAELKVLYNRTLHAYQRADVDLDAVITLLLEEGFISQQEQGLRITYLGRITARLSLSPSEIVLSRNLLELGVRSPYDLILTIAAWTSLSPRIWCAWEDIETISEVIDPLPAILLDAAVESLPVSRRVLLSATKTLAVLSQNESVGSLAKRFGVYPVEVDRLRQKTPEMLLALAQVLEPLGFPQLEQVAKDAAAIAQSGLPVEAVPLLDLRGIGPVLARRLYEEEFTPANLAQAKPEVVAEINGISLKGARRLVEEAKRLTPRTYSRHRYSSNGQQQVWSHSIDPYRLRRSLELKHRVSPNPSQRMVFGGSEERSVLRQRCRYHCSCPDHAQHGGDCKHILYCKRVDGDSGVLSAIADLPTAVQTSLRTGLAALWQSTNRRVPWS